MYALRQVVDQIWDQWGVPIAVGLAAVPVAVVVALGLTARRRRTGVDPGWALRSAVAEVGMVVGTVPWVWMILTPLHGGHRGYNLIPFRDLVAEFQVGGVASAVVQIVGNLLVFAALGFFLPVRLPVGPLTCLVTGAVCSATVEALQWVLNLGRFSSVDDVLVNAVGALLASLASRRWWMSRRPVVNRVSDVRDTVVQR